MPPGLERFGRPRAVVVFLFLSFLSLLRQKLPPIHVREPQGREVHWTSRYHCFRFPVSSGFRESIEVMNNDDSWRRHHVEGPIDDRWGFIKLIKLEKDESSGQICIIESRKEIMTEQSRNRRSYYTTKVIFRHEDYSGESLSPHSDNNGRLGMGRSDSHELQKSADDGTISRHLERSPHDYHVGDDSESNTCLTWRSTHLRSYHRPCNAFLDLIHETTNGGNKTIRLRAGARHKAPVTTNFSETSLAGFTAGELPSKLYKPNEISCWPPNHDLGVTDPTFDALKQMLGISGGAETITADGDERSIVFINGGRNDPKDLIYLSFDPAAKMGKMRREYLPPAEKDGEGSCRSERPRPTRRWEGPVHPFSLRLQVDSHEHREAIATLQDPTPCRRTALDVPFSALSENTSSIGSYPEEENAVWATRETLWYQRLSPSLSFAEDTFDMNTSGG